MHCKYCRASTFADIVDCSDSICAHTISEIKWREDDSTVVVVDGDDDALLIVLASTN